MVLYVCNELERGENLGGVGRWWIGQNGLTKVWLEFNYYCYYYKLATP